MNEKPAYIDDGGTIHREGDRVYCYYTMTPGVILEGSGTYEGWFDFQQDDGKRHVLNGQRICTLEHARKMGWPNAE
jgi:hypothetical protein